MSDTGVRVSLTLSAFVEYGSQGLEGGEDLREGGEEWHPFRRLWLSVYILINIVKTVNFCVLKFLIYPEREIPG
jgi:hypothetical protein